VRSPVREVLSKDYSPQRISYRKKPLVLVPISEWSRVSYREHPFHKYPSRLPPPRRTSRHFNCCYCMACSPCKPPPPTQDPPHFLEPTVETGDDKRHVVIAKTEVVGWRLMQKTPWSEIPEANSIGSVRSGGACSGVQPLSIPPPGVPALFKRPSSPGDCSL